MNNLEAIKAKIREFSLEEAEELQGWLAGHLEDRAVLNPEFVASIERGKADLKEGRVRIRKV